MNEILRVNTARLLRLELEFLYPRRKQLGGQFSVYVSRQVEVAEHGPIQLSDRLPTPAEAALLLDWIRMYVGLACRIETLATRETLTVEDFFEKVSYVSPSVNDERRAMVSHLRFESPLVIKMLLAVGSPGALAVLITGAKRLFGLDLEFRGHRQRLGAEYETARAARAQAKQLADLIEERGIPLPWGHDGYPTIDPHASRWHAKRAQVVDSEEVDEGSL